MSEWKSIGYTDDTVFQMDGAAMAVASGNSVWTISPIPEPTPTEPHRTSLKKKTWGYEYTDPDYDRFYIEFTKKLGEDIFYVYVTYREIDTPLELGTISLKEDRDILLKARLYTLANRDEFTLAFDAVDALFEEIGPIESD